ncbi:MAG TPA: hypothetical protein VGL77_10330 [Armatimonadota bacterium]|jgi:hypothetical protein
MTTRFFLTAALILTVAARLVAADNAFTRSVTGVTLTIPAEQRYVRVGTTVTASLTLRGTTPFIPSNGLGRITIMRAEGLNAPLHAVLTLLIPPRERAPYPPVTLRLPGTPGNYIYAAAVRVHTATKDTRALLSAPVLVNAYQPTRVLASLTVALGPAGGTISVPGYPNAPCLEFAPGALRGAGKVRLEVLSTLPIPPANPLVKLWGSPLNVRIIGTTVAPNARLIVHSSARSSAARIVIAGFLNHGDWMVDVAGTGKLGYAYCPLLSPYAGALGEHPAEPLTIAAFTSPKPTRTAR